MNGAFRAAWIMVARPRRVLPALAAVALFSTLAVTFTFTTAAAPGGSRFTDPPTTLTDLANADALSQMVSRPVMVTGIVVLAASILHVTSQYSTGFIRVQFVRQPRRASWLVGQWLALASAAFIAALIGALTAVATTLICAWLWNVDTTQWGEGVWQAVSAAGNLALGMMAFSLVGSALGLVLRSSTAALSVGLVYALFESLIINVAPLGQGLLPASAFATVATAGSDGSLYARALVATTVLCATVAIGTINLLKNRDVTE
ncbi:hypothetical protein HQ607_01175 [Rhodococcus corynebacterioides]|nr:hypothetical protein [Rhodococcus corynebacterioides]